MQMVLNSYAGAARDSALQGFSLATTLISGLIQPQVQAKPSFGYAHALAFGLGDMLRSLRASAWVGEPRALEALARKIYSTRIQPSVANGLPVNPEKMRQWIGESWLAVDGPLFTSNPLRPAGEMGDGPSGPGPSAPDSSKSPS
jgi:hypothetical protein